MKINLALSNPYRRELKQIRKCEDISKEKMINEILLCKGWETYGKTFYMRCTTEQIREAYAMAKGGNESPNEWKRSVFSSRVTRNEVKATKPLKKTSKPIKCKQKTAKKLKGEYWSVFTDNMKRCIITGSFDNVVPHHIFGKANKANSETYGFMLPLKFDWHTTTKYSIHQDRNLDLKWKRKCEDYWLNQMHKTKEEWLNEFGRWW